MNCYVYVIVRQCILYCICSVLEVSNNNIIIIKLIITKIFNVQYIILSCKSNIVESLKGK